MNANTESLHQGANNRLYTKSTDFARKYVKKRRGSWSEAHHALCQTWWSQCYGMGMFGCQLNHWCLLMMWLVIEVARCIMKCTGLYSLLSFRQNAAALTGQMVNDAKHNCKSNPFEIFSDVNPIEHMLFRSYVQNLRQVFVHEIMVLAVT